MKEQKDGAVKIFRGDFVRQDSGIPKFVTHPLGLWICYRIGTVISYRASGSIIFVIINNIRRKFNDKLILSKPHDKKY